VRMFTLESMKSFRNHVSKVYSNAHKHARNANMSAGDAAAAAVRARLQLLSKTFCVFLSWCFQTCYVFSFLMSQASLLCYVFLICSQVGSSAWSA
jgi:hypothetical protein